MNYTNIWIETGEPIMSAFSTVAQILAPIALVLFIVLLFGIFRDDTDNDNGGDGKDKKIYPPKGGNEYNEEILVKYK